jgi:hypothetical protein
MNKEKRERKNIERSNCCLGWVVDMEKGKKGKQKLSMIRLVDAFNVKNKHTRACVCKNEDGK